MFLLVWWWSNVFFVILICHGHKENFQKYKQTNYRCYVAHTLKLFTPSSNNSLLLTDKRDGQKCCKRLHQSRADNQSNGTAEALLQYCTGWCSVVFRGERAQTAQVIKTKKTVAVLFTKTNWRVLLFRQRKKWQKQFGNLPGLLSTSGVAFLLDQSKNTLKVDQQLR